MRKGVITVYLSLIFLIMVSFILALLESARVYTIETMTERYADIAAEMVFSAYVRPLAEYYDLLAVDGGEEVNLSAFERFFAMNLEENGQNRSFGLYGSLLSAEVSGIQTLKDNNWESMLDQIVDYESYALGELAISSIKALLTQLQNTNLDETVGQYSELLESDGEEMVSLLEELEEDEESCEDNGESVTGTDPRQGIAGWLKSGLLNLVMGDKNVSGKQIDVSQCSWQVSESSKQSVFSSFESYSVVSDLLSKQDLTDKIYEGLQEQGTQVLVNLYIPNKFCLLRQSDSETETAIEHVLDYEVEYILFGHATDRENLESTVTDLFLMRTLLNLVYLYGSQSKDAVITAVVEAMTVTSAIPVVGAVLKLLVMLCWASAEAVVDCAALADGKNVPLMKSEDTWNLTMEQLMAIAKNGGNASAYVRDGTKGMDYEQYVLMLLMFTSSEKKLVRASQLMECNIRLISGYEDFCIADCVTSAVFSGTVEIQAKFFSSDSWKKTYEVAYSY